jgi:hypothetical protein
MVGLAFKRLTLDAIPFPVLLIDKNYKVVRMVIYGNKEHLLITIMDITMEKEREKRLFYLATTDRLTKLLNRHAGIKNV